MVDYIVSILYSKNSNDKNYIHKYIAEITGYKEMSRLRSFTISIQFVEKH